MPRKIPMTSRDYWDAYGGLSPRAFLPILSLVGLARAMGAPQSSPELRAFCHLASHARRGYWLFESGSAKDRRQYDALCEFIEESHLFDNLIGDWYGERWVKPPKGMDGASDVECIAAYMIVSSATYMQVGERFPEYSEKSRPKTAERALRNLMDANVIHRVFEGGRDIASLYVFLPIVVTNDDGEVYHIWPGFDLSDGDEDYEATSGRPRPEWPWRD